MEIKIHYSELEKIKIKRICSLIMSEISKLEHNLIIKKIDSETINLQITDNETLMSIVGQFDQN